MGANGGNGMSIVVIRAIELCPGRELGVEAGAAQKVQGEDSLRDEEAPKVQGELWIRGTEASNEVVLECLDGSLGSIAAVDVGRGELVGHILLMEILLEDGGALIVKGVELGSAAGRDELVVFLLVSG